MRKMAIGAGLAILTLTGCEEFTFTEETTTAEDSYLALQDDTTAIRSQLDLLDTTDIASLPLTGTATYDGTALIALTTPTRDSELIGNASITADFATDILSGQMGGFYGSIDDGEVEAFDGNITISKGLIDRTDTTVIDAKVDGTLVGSTDVLDVNATLNGNFLGEPTFLDEAPDGIELSATDTSVFTLNGDVVTGGMDVVGLR